MTRTPTRRRYLVASVAAGVAAIAGCSDGGNDEEAPAGGDDEEAENDTDTEGESAAPSEQDEGNESDADGNDSEGDESVEDIDHENPDGSVSFVSPEDGDEVSSPVEVEMEVEGLELRAVDEADAPEEGYGHLHVIVDEDCIDPGYVIPEEDGYHHLSEGGRTTELELEAGEHELCAQAGDAQHNAYELTDEIAIEVTDGDGSGNDSGDGTDDETNETNVDEEQ